MEAKDFLRQVRTIDILVDNKQKEIDRLKSAAYYPKGNTLEDTVIKIVEYERELNETIDILIDKKREVQSVIDKLHNPDIVDILYKRYFQYYTWEHIVAEKNYTFQWLHKLHARGLKEIQGLLNKR